MISPAKFPGAVYARDASTDVEVKVAYEKSYGQVTYVTETYPS